MTATASTDYRVVDPATGETVQEYPQATNAQIAEALSRADEAFEGWRRTPAKERAAVLTRVAELYEQRKDELAAVITQEMGKPVAQAAGEIDIVVSIYRFYADKGPSFLGDEELDVASGGRAVVRKEPVGTLLGIMPWNYPYYQVARFAAPNLMLGNTMLLKHAPQCPRSALAMERIFADAGLPSGAYVNIFASNEQVAELIADPRIQGVSLTGSERAGAAVAEIAGRNLKKVVLELGGSDPFLVLGTNDLDRAVRQAFVGRMGNAGQACNAAKRIIVLDEHYEPFVERFTAATRDVRPGDPTSADTFMGPLSSENAVRMLAEQVDDAVDKGATVLAGGRRMDRPGAWYEPTLLTGIRPGMRAYTEELFGPVAMVYQVGSEEEAVELANTTPYGLGACVFSDDEQQARRVADRLEAGMVFVNAFVGSAAELPFGGVKRSGFGRELGRYGMEEFVNHKLIHFSR
ncbi:succinate-semialdehyde dehydrogenase / glutarate-semialdehyde dehydrogenase [Actinopolymorpha cephalotaxi]|uniref:Succinate-semialdehyde dehydrogenase / glutarate-semialdehyde dehydrogenase n=1 Tax=Actinopolymorpha cephalotaxi TaxID=504797 RepID=A0A1I2QWB3_9ACTN|nr:NAD-dependent succinate-semialdehyde dehydrogenase [Actinopolymorpha cephalotaxi]NYH82444.1 succinate-semialdehyde dehydrogenase/glutarate-semialdehyde dehydrogenase [Actinopolymorpha cephalotaxi]SFG32865.1 succinate-semialdehyde dehydrogenase / glutarate-semialdehyde dehydrogenase [Actinopolymorpha cephalotaxi]